MAGELRDLIYFDFDKAASVYSQVEGGLLKETQEATEGAKETRGGAQVDLKIFKPELSKSSQEKTSTLESKVLHHDLLTRLETVLQEMELLVDVNEEADSEDFDYSDQSLHSIVSKPSFVIAEGWASIEDYSRFDFFTTHLKELAGFIKRCEVQGIEQSEEYKTLKEAVDSMKEEVRKEKNGKRKAQMKFQVKELEQQVDGFLATDNSLDEDLPDWLLEGINLFITTLMPNRINLRVYPFEENARFEILSNLKRDCFVESDLENVAFAYGTRPNIQLSVFGLITSVPSKDGVVFDPMENREEDSEKGEDQFENSFRQIFRAYEEFERFVRFSHYPNVTIYPIAVYQRLS